MSDRRPGSDREGFVLALVVLMLFAIAMAGAVGYVAVQTEFTLATGSRDGTQAFSVARGGLERFLAEQVGVVGDSVSYAIGNGIATVTSRQVAEQDSVDFLYYIRSEGTVTDPRTPTNPATRVVGTYAWQHTSPVPFKAAFMAAMKKVEVSGGKVYGFYSVSAYVDGTDHATSSQCTGGGTTSIAGVIDANQVKTNSGGTITGSPTKTTFSSDSAVIDSAGIRWDILSDSTFPVDFDGSAPDWGSIPSDSFPVVRYTGDLSAGSSWLNTSTGTPHGVLIVTGKLTMTSGFYWDGIVLAGSLGNVSAYWPWQAPRVNGLLIGGLNDTDTSVTLESGYYYYNYCYAYSADKSLSYVDPVNNTLFEIN